jgi:hypothetical protein
MKLSRYGDIVAIPFFFLLVIYFGKKPVLTEEERVLFLFCVGGFLADVYFVFFEG